MDIVLSDFSTYQLTPTLHQDDIARYFAWVMAVGRCQDEVVTDQGKAKEIYAECLESVSHYGVSSEMINRRQFSIVDSSADPTLLASIREGVLPVFNSKDQETSHGSPLEDRMNYFSEKMPMVFDALYADAPAPPPDDIIHVTCSGYVSPSPAQRFVSKQGWFTTNVTHSYHMGCYGAFPPVNMAVGFLASSHHVLLSAKKKVDIVHTELLSSHADFSAQKPSDIVVMTLFADGFAKYSAYTEPAFLDRKNIPSTDSKPKRGLKIRSSHNEIFPDSLEEMTWIPKSHVFEMYLSKNVPLLIRDRIVPFISELTRMAGVDFETEKKNILFAIHPGGPKILTHIRDCLSIGEHQLKWSRDVLYHHGNMSSASVPHIWKSMVEDETITAGTIVVSVAFGPGLTATGLVFEVV